MGLIYTLPVAALGARRVHTLARYRALTLALAVPSQIVFECRAFALYARCRRMCRIQ